MNKTLTYQDGLLAALAVVSAEHLQDPTEEHGDVVYERAIADCENAIGNLLAAHPGHPEPRAEVTDTERLDWMIAQQAWIQWTVRDGSIRQCQVYDQDEDENYHILSGDDRYFNTPRDAIDVARAGGQHAKE
ncbi:hypothetical protein [Burkholderia anthina]|uniref:hypothetical protein n=1 Tax=Burkholderia anthina TaxID=179879 RepID=UPI001FC7CE29|nr:hypothetical protein [Burkholderia anthina]